MSSESNLSHEDVTRILGIVDKLNDIEVRLEIDGMKLHVRKFSADAADGRGLPGGAPLAAQVDSVREAPASAAPPTVASAPQPAAAPAPQAAPVNGAPPASAAQPGAVVVRAPMLGRFFRASSPTDAPFVEIGSKVGPDDTVCIIEVMKLFSTVKAGVRGTIAGIAIENGEMVEHDAVLFTVRPE